ncbi:hypothetical protein BGZ65_006304 [Modicella reniformis]|uniref:Uncharacterized protein n=1 Tax=Modicella reniformis TaxID=1440133 RepID=A0A9P6MGF8_9FUNG|nr:hypothetical protein BGZ65_006304 [Modicella reniformis]
MPTYRATLDGAREQLKAYRRRESKITRGTLQIDHAGPTYDVTEDAKLKHELEITSSELLSKIEEYEGLVKELIASHQIGDDAQSILPPKTVADSHHFVYQSNKTDSATLDMSILRFGLAKMRSFKSVDENDIENNTQNDIENDLFSLQLLAQNS